MNIVHIIGNGFDLNLNLKTSYKDFYNYYINIESKSKNIELLKKEIKNDSDNWSDLEIALGNFTDKVETVEEFEAIRQDIILNLSHYLKSIEDNFDLDSANGHEILVYLSSPYIELRNGDKEIFKSFINPLKHEISNVDTISFNYTSILDKLVESFIDKKVSVANAISNNSVLKKVKHIHGSLQERLIIGVNDNSQVYNKNFTSDIDFKEAFIKTEYNKASNHLVDKECIKLLDNANIICVFGSSLGKTDRFWWEMICNKVLINDCKLIIYHKCPHIKNNLFDNLISKEIRNIKEKFVAFHPGLDDKQREKIKSNIYVGINTNFLNVLKEVPIQN